MTCREVMTADPICCLPDDPATEIARIMKTEDVGSVPICEDHKTKRLLGIVTDRDLALKIVAEGRDAGRATGKEIMTRDPVACRGEDDIQRALEAMETHQVRRIPVVDESDGLIGIIAQADVALRTREPEKTAEVVEEISRPERKAA